MEDLPFWSLDQQIQKSNHFPHVGGKNKCVLDPTTPLHPFPTHLLHVAQTLGWLYKKQTLSSKGLYIFYII